MKILVTGANGYIGQRLIARLVDEGHSIIALVRSIERFEVIDGWHNNVKAVEGDLFNPKTLQSLPEDIDLAYYLIHSLAKKNEDIIALEVTAAQNFLSRIEKTKAKQIIYLSGLVSDKNLSPHLQSRLHTQKTLESGSIPVTTLRAGIILGAGSASFEIMRDLVEKLPIMIAPKWVTNKCQPISIVDVLDYLVGVLNKEACFGKTFDIGGPEALTYKEMLLRFANIRKLKRWIIEVPVFTPRLSSYWLYLITATNFTIARNLVESLKNNALCTENRIQAILPKKCLSFEDALQRTFSKIEDHAILSSWKDALVSSDLDPHLAKYVKVPSHGCLTNKQKINFACSEECVVKTIWEIGGDRGWYSMNFLWSLRGRIDLILGGTGLRRGRTHPSRLRSGDALDFWRVILADKKNQVLLLYAEMRIPGEAWLEFRIKNHTLYQTATFRPRGILGRLYWLILSPFHLILFRRMAKNIVTYAKDHK